MIIPSLVLLILAGVLIGCGVYLVLERTLTRVFIGLSLVGTGINVLLLSVGSNPGNPPLIQDFSPETMVDPLPQAMMLTAIVLTLGTTAFGLAMAYRSWRLSGHDEVADDVEDRRLARRAALARLSERTTDHSEVDEIGTDLDQRISDALNTNEIVDSEAEEQQQ